MEKMRRMLEYAYKIAEEHRVPVILDVDVLLRLEVVIEHARRAVYRVQDVAHGYRLVSLL